MRHPGDISSPAMRRVRGLIALGAMVLVAAVVLPVGTGASAPAPPVTRDIVWPGDFTAQFVRLDRTGISSGTEYRDATGRRTRTDTQTAGGTVTVLRLYGPTSHTRYTIKGGTCEVATVAEPWTDIIASQARKIGTTRIGGRTLTHWLGKGPGGVPALVGLDSAPPASAADWPAYVAQGSGIRSVITTMPQDQHIPGRPSPSLFAVPSICT